MPAAIKVPPAIEYFWLACIQSGEFSLSEIAEKFGVSRDTVARRIKKAKYTPIPDLEVLIPGDYRGSADAGERPKAECGHHEPIAVGDQVYCARCHQTGIEDHPLLWRNPAAEPAPDPRPPDPPDPGKPPTRRQRRAARKAARQAGP